MVRYHNLKSVMQAMRVYVNFDIQEFQAYRQQKDTYRMSQGCR
jgi:16S rRNA C1402 N4-methylase RsmH